MEWQPIETAPKDGTQILACSIDYPRDISIISFYGTYRGGEWIGMCDGARCIEAQGDTFTDYNQPFVTHWMPLPDLPSKQQPPKGDD